MSIIKSPRGEQSLDVFFIPKTIAVIGATDKENSVGKTILMNLTTGTFKGIVFPVNPKRNEILGFKTYPDLKSIPQEIDLAIIVTPASSVPGIIRECSEVGVRGVVIISAGFKEVGEEGVKLEQEILAIARKSGIRIIGPNCLGVMSPLTGLNATFAAGIANAGSVGFISQSGALCTAILDWSLQNNVGFSAFLSLGSMIDVGWGDLINYLGQDPQTKSIVIYMETIGDARAFLSAAREVALNKPIIIIKPGRTEAAVKATASHTGSLAGSDDVLEAAFARSGVLRVNSIADLFYMADVLSKQPNPKGPKLTILTNGGGPGVLAADALIIGHGELTDITQETIEALDKVLPPTWSHHNPIDVIGDASPERFEKSVKIAIEDPNADGLLVILTPQAMTDPTATAEALKIYAKAGKPILASWMGGASVEDGKKILNEAGIPTFSYPDTAARIFNYMWTYTNNLKLIYEIPSLVYDEKVETPDRKLTAEIIAKAGSEGRTILTETESKNLLRAYNIPTVPTSIADSIDKAIEDANKMGYPVVLKLYSATITHKTDVGGVVLNIDSPEAVRFAFDTIKNSVTTKVGAEHFQGVTIQPMIKSDGAYEIIIGSSLDSQFGPVLLFGTGGQLVEVFKDRALALPPLNATLARRMMERTKIYHALKGVRGRAPVNLEELEAILVCFSNLVVEQPRIKEIDINPLMASADGLIALDARILLHDANVDLTTIPKIAIRPYPTQYINEWMTAENLKVIFRPIRPEDEPEMVRFHQRLSEKSVYLRYLEAISLNQRTNHENLVRNCFIDYDREIAIVAEMNNSKTGLLEIVGVGRIRKSIGFNSGSIAIVVRDDFQGAGIGSELVKRMIEIGVDEKLSLINADVLSENENGISMLKNLGFTIRESAKEGIVHAEFLIE
ncbi:bifunctional acetate--CoA ligase family protein/GNAT family N-acetyltransferase [Bacteriovorax sp. PP10]|uniref:Bifunctional acetate--CoA ligase family protein/GNAT family N-acetyltransferase n=1 Tax=Bacteriovorax antarcticus TaxID=3088717 RepID=A0ABU5VTD0_9BACT|nr:bifunctional acetate--CoA ligase family protein/GNAT family N-acetyltransferase [Bacteriovorax sp. PP10]MEA9356251.1 bifunctional acetate--CoA ligase family protein/GNAT family N-acetyltransferase [Bacteriovorax sp. PP10]